MREKVENEGKGRERIKRQRKGKKEKKIEKEGIGRVRRKRDGEGMKKVRKGKRRITKRKRKTDGHRIFQFSHSDHSSTILFYLIKSYFKLSNLILYYSIVF